MELQDGTTEGALRGTWIPQWTVVPLLYHHHPLPFSIPVIAMVVLVTYLSYPDSLFVFPLTGTLSMCCRQAIHPKAKTIIIIIIIIIIILEASKGDPVS